MNIKKLAEEFVKKPGNSTVSVEMLVNFYKFIESQNVEDEILASKLGLTYTGVADYWVMSGSPSRIVYEFTGFGFREIK